jgi:hypothetical protein
MTLVTLAGPHPKPHPAHHHSSRFVVSTSTLRQSCVLVYKFGADQPTLAFRSLCPKEIGVRLFRTPRIATNLLGR